MGKYAVVLLTLSFAACGDDVDASRAASTTHEESAPEMSTMPSPDETVPDAQAPPPPEAVLSISKQLALSPEAAEFGTCPQQHGRITFPSQPPFALQSSTPDSTIEGLEMISSGVRCVVRGDGDELQVSIEIEDQQVGGVGIFRLTGVELIGGVPTGGNLFWAYQGFGYSGDCSVVVDARADAPDGRFIAPGTAKLSFACDPFTNPDLQACRAEGTVFVRNCSR